MKLPTQLSTRSPLVRQPPRDDGSYRSMGRLGPPLLVRPSKNSPVADLQPRPAESKPCMDYIIRVIATGLISGTVTVSAPSKADAIAKVEHRINPLLRQVGYEFRLEFLESLERPQSARQLNPRGLPSDGSSLGMKV